MSQNTTLFEAGYVYDYLSDPDRVAVFDQPHGRFIVLDPVRKVKAEVKTDDVQKSSPRRFASRPRTARGIHEFRGRPEL